MFLENSRSPKPSQYKNSRDRVGLGRVDEVELMRTKQENVS